jgi:cytochrome c oxidase subunit 2
MRHFVIVGVLVILMAALTYFGLTSLGLMPVEASAQSIPVDWMWNLDVQAMSFLFALIFVPLVYSLIVFRRRKGETGDGEHMEGNTTLEVTWTVIPLLAVTIFAYLGAYTLGETRVADPNALVINVKAVQWAWSFDYPDGFTATELHLPLNRQVLLKLQSADVIHSFWVPEFRIKQDVVPGRVTEYRITPILVGNYKVRCAELCGTSHAYMEAPVIVESQANYDAWVSAQAAAAKTLESIPGPNAQRGQKIYEQYCKACHSIDGSKGNGPTWSGLYGSTVRLNDGTTAVADDTYITESIKDPAAKVAQGFDAMSFNPTNAGIDDAKIADLIAFIKTLK